MQPKKYCFVIMPFGNYGTTEFTRNSKIYSTMIKPVLADCGYDAKRADELEHPGSITRDIIEWLHKSDLVIADLSGRNANVYYELGVRHALFRSGTIPIIQEGDTLPFDIASYKAIFYSCELDGPETFRNHLKRRIAAFENDQHNRPDNPVYDFIGDKLFVHDPANYVLKNEHLKKLELIDTLSTQIENLKNKNKEMQSQSSSEIDTVSRQKQDEIAALKEKISTLESRLARQLKDTTGKVTKFRDTPEELSTEAVKALLAENDFYCRKNGYTESYCNTTGKGFSNDYELQSDGKVIYDNASGLIWQQCGSSDSMDYEEAQQYINKLNNEKFAGYRNWRLPTLEEAMSLLEPEELNGDLYIDPIFDKIQRWIWTCDKFAGSSRRWVVLFSSGLCDSLLVDSLFVRAVHSR